MSETMEPHVRSEQWNALAHALTFEPGQPVEVMAKRYCGPGVITNRTHWDSHIVWLDHEGLTLAVEIPNGNVWFYRALHVYHATDSAHQERRTPDPKRTT